jgi:hypothetical protein
VQAAFAALMLEESADAKKAAKKHPTKAKKNKK